MFCDIKQEQSDASYVCACVCEAQKLSVTVCICVCVPCIISECDGVLIAVADKCTASVRRERLLNRAV